MCHVCIPVPVFVFPGVPTPASSLRIVDVLAADQDRPRYVSLQHEPRAAWLISSNNETQRQRGGQGSSRAFMSVRGRQGNSNKGVKAASLKSDRSKDCFLAVFTVIKAQTGSSLITALNYQSVNTEIFYPM